MTIPQGSSLSQIADILEQRGVVEDAGFFQLRARLTGHSGDLRPGSYEMRKDMSFTAALDALQEGVPPNVVQVAIPEGLSRTEIRPLTKGLPWQLRAREPTLPAAQPGRLQGAPRREPRGLPLPGDLRAEEGPAGQGAGQRPARRSSRRTSARWTCATPGART